MAPASAAVVVYTYTGNNFSSLNNFSSSITGVTYTATDHISGSLSFTDGHHTFTPANTNFAAPYNSAFQFSNNAAGAISRWDIVLTDPNVSASNPNLSSLSSFNSPGVFTQDHAFQTRCGGDPYGGQNILGSTNGTISNSPGTWTVESVSAVPEPQE